MAGIRYTHSTESSGIRYGGKRAFHSLQVLENGTANFIRLFRILISIPRKQGVPEQRGGKGAGKQQPRTNWENGLPGILEQLPPQGNGTAVQLEKQFGGNPVRSRLSIQARPSVCGHLHHLQQARHGRLFPFRRRKALPYRPPQATGAFFQAGLRAVQKDLFSLQRSRVHSGQEENQQITFHHQSSGQPGGIPAIVD